MAKPRGKDRPDFIVTNIAGNTTFVELFYNAFYSFDASFANNDSVGPDAITKKIDALIYWEYGRLLVHF